MANITNVLRKDDFSWIMTEKKSLKLQFSYFHYKRASLS